MSPAMLSASVTMAFASSPVCAASARAACSAGSTLRLQDLYSSALAVRRERAGGADGTSVSSSGPSAFNSRATSQLAQFEMHTTALDADSASHAPHTHVQEEIVLILRGHVTMHIDGKLIPAAPGDLVFLPSRIPHALINTGKEQCEYFAFQWKN